jgi:Putative threonine/serine exporter
MSVAKTDHCVVMVNSELSVCEEDYEDLNEETLTPSTLTETLHLYPNLSYPQTLISTVNKKHKPSRHCQRARPKSSQSLNDRTSFNTKQKFLVSLAQDLTSYGSPTHRIEHLLESVAKSIGLDDASFFVLPGITMISLNYRDISRHINRKTAR